VIPTRPSRLLLAAAVVLTVAWGTIGAARWLAHGAPPPDPASDLDVPRLLEWTDAAPDVQGSIEGIPILSYHYFREGLTAERVLRVLGAVLLNMPTLPDKDYWSLAVPEFERQMRYLHDNGYRTLTLDELTAWLDGRAARPERAVVLTIDDGDESVVRLAAPVLERYGFHATLFLLTGRTGERGWNDIDFVTWPQLRALERKGVLAVESHTHDMHTKVRRGGVPVPRFLAESRDARGRVAADSELGRDLVASREAIRRELGRDCRYLAWPFGFGEAAVDSVAHALGFRRIFTLAPRRAVRDFRDIWAEHPDDALGRYGVTARTSFRTFRRLVEGGSSTESGH
jgi:peptidoglycan/xylan/chitin deacetylase (PgdA/CDA1 family)